MVWFNNAVSIDAISARVMSSVGRYVVAQVAAVATVAQVSPVTPALYRPIIASIDSNPTVAISE